jgi:serine/threonine-protein kinase
MSGTDAPGGGELSASAARLCNAVCDRFEAAWQAAGGSGPHPLIEAFLADVAEPVRAVVLGELILLDVHYRRRLGESLGPADYLKRFPRLDPAWLAGVVGPEAAVKPIPTTVTGASSPAADSLPEPSLAGGDTLAAGNPPAEAPPAGRYTRGRLHATGGIGRVWLARDHALGRQVALKELRPDRAADAALRARFLEEARITGQLEHPGIVPVYELAGDPGGEPFYTMRFVKGRTLREAVADYHRKRQQGRAGPLDLRGLLDVFVAVCNVVAYAHSRGVLHRDLKGQNVVLGDYGEVFVLDWGLAKVVGAAGAAAAAPVDPGDGPREATVLGQVLGTPGYMAPEQATGDTDRIDERTDVYGLGALLYEILTGRAPFQGADAEAVLAQVLHEAPAPPRAVVPGVHAALQAVCLKALSKDPAQRFPRALELAQEVRRFLADEPVACYPDPWAVRVRRWVGRHRLLVTGAAAAGLVAVATLGAATALLQAANGRERASRVAAEENFRLAQDVVESYLVRVSGDERLKSLGMEKLRRDLLLQAKEVYEQFARREEGGPALAARRARALHGLGLIEAEIGDREKALGLYREALAIFQGLAPEPDVEDGLARVARDLAVWHEDAERWDEARGYFEQALGAHRRLAEGEGVPRARRYQLALTLQRYGRFCAKYGEPARGKEMLDQAVRVLKRLAEEDDRTPDYPDLLANCYLALSTAHRKLLAFDQVVPTFEEILKVRQRLNRTHPDVPGYQLAYADTFVLLGHWYAFGSREAPMRAVGIYRQALPIYEKLAYHHPDVPLYAKKRAGTFLLIVVAALDARQPAQAKDALEKGMLLLEDLAKEHPDDPECTALRLQGRLTEAGWHAQVGDHERAARLLEQQLAELGHGQFPRTMEAQAYYNAACYFCLAAEAAQRAEPARAEAADHYLTRAVEALRQGRAAGFPADAAEIDSLKKDKDLTLLRSRGDFQQWLRETEAAVKATPR